MLLHLKIKPGQRFDRVERMGDEWLIRLKAPAIDGKANEHLIEFLSDILNLPKSSIQIKKGHTNRHKSLEINSDDKTIIAQLLKASGNLHNTM